MEHQTENSTETKSLFEELSVQELEERLELADCCICRIGTDDGSS